MSEIKGMKQLLGKIDSLEKLAGAKRGLKAGALHIKGKISQYPASTIANSPAEKHWYERGFGPRWRRKDGTIGGRKTSETLGKKWTTESRKNGLQQVIGNNTSYARWVQAAQRSGGKGPQASFHADHGWKTDEQVIAEEADTVLRFIKKEIDRDIQ